MLKRDNKNGFTLVETLVVITIVAILISIVTFNFQEARKKSRDKIRQADLQSLQLAIELYKSQNGRYPAMGCGPSGPGGHAWAGIGGGWNSSNGWGGYRCSNYILGLTPTYIAALPLDPLASGMGYIYTTNTLGTSYKVILWGVESSFITSYGDEFARCPSAGSNCPAALPDPIYYAIYSSGAEGW